MNLVKLPKFCRKPKLFQKTVPKIALKFVIYSRGYASAEKPQNNLDMAKAEKGQNNEKDPHFKKSSGTFAGRNGFGGESTNRIREVLIKSGMQIAQTDFSLDCMKTTQEYLMYFKEFSCKTGGGFRLRKICKQDACRDLFSASLAKTSNDTEKLSYYKGTRYTHYIVVDYIDRSRLQIETADCCWTEAYRGHFMVAMDEAYNATKGNYMICLSQQIS